MMRFEIDINFKGDARQTHLLTQILQRLDVIERKEATIMASIDDVITDVTAETTLIGGVQTLVQGLKDQLAAALAGTNIPADVQAKIDAAFAGLEANKTALALVTNTPTPPPAP